MTITVIRTVIIYFIIILALRLMGKRQIGELKPQELVITILISAIATVPLEDNGMPLSSSVIPIVIFISLEIIESVICMKSARLRDLIQGKPMFIIKNGELQQSTMKKLRYTMDDIIDALRQQGAFDISEVENAIVETNGSLSIQLKSEAAPLTPSDIGLKPNKAETPTTIIMDGKTVSDYFGNSNISKSEIELIVTANNINISEIMMMSITDSGKIYVIKKDKE